MTTSHATNSDSPQLPQVVGLFGATMMGLGSIIGTGIFVSVALAAGVTGPSVILAIVVAAIVAACNGLSSAQLAAAHPVSGGTYEYGYRWLHPSLGFLAGWMFVCAKSASAASAALGFAGYLFSVVGREGSRWHWLAATTCVVIVTCLVLSGLRRSNVVNNVIVSVSILSLIVFAVAGSSLAIQGSSENLRPFFVAKDGGFAAGFLEACALMFVAFTGYGRIATLGEEVENPRRNIPWAIIVTLLASSAIYVAVAFVAVATVGAQEFASAGTMQAAPLENVASRFSVAGVGPTVAIGAMTAMLGVLLNLILGLSRVVLAMGRRRDIPSVFGRLNRDGTTPYPAIVLVGLTVAGLSLIGNVKTTWSFSAFTVLIYYTLTNMAALRMNANERRYPRVVGWLGLCGCLFLAFWVESTIWIAGSILIAVGFIWWFVANIAKPFDRA